MTILVAAVGALSTTLGQSLLLTLLFPQFMTVFGPYVIVGLLLLNGGLAVLFVLVDSAF